MEKNENIVWKNKYETLGNKNPKDIVESICSNLSQITDGKVFAEINKVNKSIGSMYTSESLAEKIDYFSKQIKTSPIDNLGVLNNNTLETYSISIRTPKYPDYNYRMMFIEFNFTYYPVKIVFDEEISEEIGCEEILIAKNEKEFTSIINNAVRTEKVTSIIEGLLTAIKINNK